MGRTKRQRGASLMELIVYTVLFSMVATGVAAAFSAGNRWYSTTRLVIQAEQDAHNLPVKLAQELMESNLGGIQFYPCSADQYAPRGITFISPRDTSSKFNINPLTGRARYYKYICYYVGPDPTNAGMYAVFRKEYAPPGLNPDARPVPLSTAYCTEWFRDNRALRAQIVAHNIVPAATAWGNSGFDIYSGDPESGSENHESVSNPICIEVSTATDTRGATNNIKSSVLLSVRN